MTNLASIARAALIGAALAGAAAAAASAAPTQATPVAKPLAVAKVFQSRDRYNRRVTIHNQTGWTMLRFYASDSRTDSWEEDILGRDTLDSGRNWAVNIDDGSGACVYDFRAEFTNGQVLERRNINVCQIADYYYTR